jgi:hypothetical protein
MAGLTSTRAFHEKGNGFINRDSDYIRKSK